MVIVGYVDTHSIFRSIGNFFRREKENERKRIYICLFTLLYSSGYPSACTLSVSLTLFLSGVIRFKSTYHIYALILSSFLRQNLRRKIPFDNITQQFYTFHDVFVSQKRTTSYFQIAPKVFSFSRLNFLNLHIFSKVSSFYRITLLRITYVRITYVQSTMIQTKKK